MTTAATWNVLHRVHAENWHEDVLEHWPDEAARIAAITARVAARTERVIALQEVSGDLLAGLREALPGRTVHTLRYPRVPVPRNGISPLRDNREFLVLLIDGPSREVAAESFRDDPGKGALAVHTAGLLVIATHVSGDRRRTRELARLAELAAMEGAAVLLGDFNTDRNAVAAGLGPGFTVAEPAQGSPPTRPGSARSIDHVVGRGAGIGRVDVEDMGGLSDHNLVRADITG